MGLFTCSEEYEQNKFLKGFYCCGSLIRKTLARSKINLFFLSDNTHRLLVKKNICLLCKEFFNYVTYNTYNPWFFVDICNSQIYAFLQKQVICSVYSKAGAGQLINLTVATSRKAIFIYVHLVLHPQIYYISTMLPMKLHP